MHTETIAHRSFFIFYTSGVLLASTRFLQETRYGCTYHVPPTHDPRATDGL